MTDQTRIQKYDLGYSACFVAVLVEYDFCVLNDVAGFGGYDCWFILDKSATSVRNRWCFVGSCKCSLGADKVVLEEDALSSLFSIVALLKLCARLIIVFNVFGWSHRSVRPQVGIRSPWCFS